MAVKEIRELENEVREVDVVDAVKDADSWEDRDFVDEDDDSEDEEEDGKDFSIGDTMLARGEEKESWKGESLEESVWDEKSEDWDGEGVDESEGFSYEVASGGDDMYGTGVAQDMYGQSSAGSDLYGVTSEESGGGLYGTNSGAGDTYNVGDSGKGKSGVTTYAVATSKKKKSSGRTGKKSGLENMNRSKKRHSKGVSMY